MVVFRHKCSVTGNVYRTSIPLAVRFEMRLYAPAGEYMFLWLDAHDCIVGGGTLSSEIIDYEFIED